MGGIDQGVQLWAVVFAAIVFVPRRVQISKGQRVVIIRAPTRQHHVEVTGGHFGQSLLEDLFVDFHRDAKGGFQGLLHPLGLHAGYGVVAGQQTKGGGSPSPSSCRAAADGLGQPAFGADLVGGYSCRSSIFSPINQPGNSDTPGS